jgi:hypothetical protein
MLMNEKRNSAHSPTLLFTAQAVRDGVEFFFKCATAAPGYKYLVCLDFPFFLSSFSFSSASCPANFA